MRTYVGKLKSLLRKDWIPYAVPFVLFLLLTEPARFFPSLSPYLYIAKTILTGGLLWFWRNKYRPDLSPALSFREWLTALFCGLMVLVIWIVPDEYLFQISSDTAFDPYGLCDSKAAAVGLIAVRLLGAALVVPVMEELFWRSFLMRYLISTDFRSVPMGAFSWISFIGVAILFGLEHRRLVVGIVAGAIYGLLLIRQKKLRGVIMAHGATNLGLGIYVLLTGSWTFW